MFLLEIINIIFTTFFGTLDVIPSLFSDILHSIKSLSIIYWVCCCLGIPLFISTIINYCLKKFLKNFNKMRRYFIGTRHDKK